MNIFVTGALGHIGSRMIRELPELLPGSKFTMVDNMTTQRYCSLFNLPDNVRYNFMEDDVLSMDLLPEVRNSDVVLHFAAITDAARSFENKAQVETVNFGATAKVSKACYICKTPMVHISSTSVYGTQNKVVDEDCDPEELQPQSPYADTKLKEEALLHALGRENELNYVICRFGTICGPSPGMRFHTAVNKFCWQAVMGQPLTVWETALHQKRPYLDLTDAVRAVAFIIKNRMFNKQVYNILTENLTVNNIICSIKESIDDVNIEYVNSRIMNQLSYEVKNRRFIDMGFQFNGSIKASVADTINVLKSSGGNHA